MKYDKRLESFIKVFYVLVLMFFVLNNYKFFIFIALHEIGHLICGVICGYNVKKLTLLPFGFSLCFKEVFIRPRDNVIISLFGPITNLIFFAMFYLINILYPSNIIEDLMYINLTLLVFNMIPVGFLDGGRVLKELITMYISFYLGNLIINLNGIIFGCIILLLCIYISTIASKIVLILIGLMLIVNSLLQLKWIKISIIKETLNKRFNKASICKYKRTKYYKKDVKIFDIMKNFSFNISYKVGIKGDSNNFINDNDLIKLYFTKGNIFLKDCFDE